MQPDATAAVLLGDRRVGTIGYHRGNTWFEYTDLSPEHPVLGQGFERDPRKRRSGSGSVPEWFANLLPENGSGLRGLIATELGEKRLHDFVLLCYLGEDLPGAVRVVPETPLTGLPRHEAPADREHEHALRFSLAGVQPKFSMHDDGKALVLPATGRGGDWIVKLPDRRFTAVPANEYAMLSWARLAGLDVPDTRLVEGSELRNLPDGLIEPDEYALAVRRFDRTGEGRVHQEDFAQVREASPGAKYDKATYEGIGRLIQALCPSPDVDEYVRRLVAMVVMGNADAHLKNWTLRYPDGRGARLSPAYDLVCVTAYPKSQADHRLAFPLGGTKESQAVTLDSFRHLATKVGAEPDRIATVARTTAQALADTWAEVKRNCPVPDLVTRSIDGRLTDLRLIDRSTR